LRVAQLKRQQAEHRLILADNRRLPGLDMQASYSTNSLNYTAHEAAQEAVKGHHPEWTFGISMEVPLGGDPRARSEYRAQVLRVQQAEVEVHSVQQSLASDLFNRSAQLEQLLAERSQAQMELEARLALEGADAAQHAAGIAPLARLLRRQADVLDARLRLSDVEARLGLARVALALIDGSLIEAYNVRLEE
jgi:outer membrane protein TolC